MAEMHNQDTSIGPGFGDRPIPDHAEASAALLRHFAGRIERGESASDFGEELVLAARVIARRL